MASEYYLPCPRCGVESKVGARSAGERLRCSCGAALDVPTLRDLRQLRPADDPATAAAAGWDRRKSLMFLGAVVTLFALVVAGFAYRRVRFERPPLTISAQSIADDAEHVQKLSPFEAVVTWSNSRNGPYLMVEAVQPDQDNLKSTAQALLAASVLGAAIGLALLLGALFFMPSSTG